MEGKTTKLQGMLEVAARDSYLLSDWLLKCRLEASKTGEIREVMKLMGVDAKLYAAHTAILEVLEGVTE